MPVQKYIFHYVHFVNKISILKRGYSKHSFDSEATRKKKRAKLRYFLFKRGGGGLHYFSTLSDISGGSINQWDVCVCWGGEESPKAKTSHEDISMNLAP